MLVNTSLFAGLIDGIKSIVKIFTNLGNLFSGLFNSLIALIYFIIYYVFMGIAFIMNFAEVLFKKFAGLDTMMTNDGKSADIVTIFISSNEVWGLFVSIIVLSIVLLLLFTFIAIIKSEFSLDVKGSAKGPIIARSLKSFAMFLIIPAVSVAGIYATNAITETVNGMFRSGNNVPMSNQVFYVAAYNANRARNDSRFARYISGQNVSGYQLDSNTKNRDDGTFSDPNSVAYEIDVAFKSERAVKGGSWVNLGFDEKVDSGLLLETMLGLQPSDPSHFSPWNPAMVNYYYKITEFDFVLGLGTAIYMAYVLLSMCVVLIKRVFEITILLLLAPPLIAMAPIDGGNASKTWQKEFIKRVISIIGPVFAINMYFVLVPVFMSISLFSGGRNISIDTGIQDWVNGGIIGGAASKLGVVASLSASYVMYDAFFQLLTLCVGMQVVKMSSALISNLLGIEDLVKSGAEATKKAVGTAVQIAGMATGAGAAVGGLVKSVGAGMAAKKGGGTFKEGWASTKDDRKKGMELLKDKTLGSKMVKESAFGELLDGDTYKNMGLTNKEIKKKENVKKQQEDLEAKEEAQQKVDEGKAKKKMKEQVTQSFEGEIGANGTLTAEKQQKNQTFVQARNDLRAAQAHTQSFIDSETGMVHDQAGYEAALEAQRQAQSTFDTAKSENDDVNQRYNAKVKERDDMLHAIDTGKVAEIFRDFNGVVQGGTIKAERTDGQVIKDQFGSTIPTEAFAELFDRMLKRIGGQPVANGTDRAINEDLNATLNETGGAAMKKSNDDDYVRRVGEKARDNMVEEDAEFVANPETQAGSKVDAIASALDRNGLADAVEQGIKEAKEALTQALKSAMLSSKMDVKGITELVAEMKKIEARAKNAQSGDDASAIVDAINKLADDVKKKTGQTK